MSLETANRLERHCLDEKEQPFDSAGLILPDLEAQTDHLACQVGELRRFNQRMELIILHLGRENRHLRGELEALQARYRRAEEHGRFLEDRLHSLRHRVSEKVARLIGRTPWLFLATRSFLLRVAAVVRTLRTRYVALPAFLRNWRAKLRNRLATRNETPKDKPVPPPHSVKQEVLRSHARRYNLKILVETGTYLGDMVHAMKSDFAQIYSIELDKALFERARDRFAADSHVELIQGDSGKELGRLIPKLNQATLFWLDGHYSAGITARGDKDTPILEELEQILNAPDRGHVIIIDDARLFGTDPAYPTLEELTKYVLSKRPGLRIDVESDSIRITP
jgi:predicted O-methyltransferase YrrM